MFKISNRYTKKWCEICWKLTIKTTEWHLHVIFVFILLWIYFTCFSSVSAIDFKPVNIAWVLSDHGDITVLYLNAQIKYIDIMDHARNINTAKTVIFHRNTDFSRILVFKRTEKYFFLKKKKNLSVILREKCLYSEFFWFAFSRIWTEYGEMRCIFPYSARMQENTDQKSSKYGYFSHSETYNTYCGSYDILENWWKVWIFFLNVI